MEALHIFNWSITAVTWGFIIYYNRKWKKHKEVCEQLLDDVHITQKETHKLQMHKFGWKQGSHPPIGVFVLLLLSDGAVILGQYTGVGYAAHQSYLFDDPDNLKVNGWQPLPVGVPEFS